MFADKIEFVKYAMIDKLRGTHPVANLCGLLNVAKSGYQAWSRGKVIPARKLEEARLLAAIRAAHDCGRGIYGPKKIQTELAMQGLTAGLNRIKRLRKLRGIGCRHKKPAGGLRHHSDRGSPYCSQACCGLQRSDGMETSMSRRGNCWEREAALGA